MSFIEQQPRAVEFLLSEANGQRSRENIVLAPLDAPLFAGQLLALNEEGLHIPYTGPTQTGEEEDPTFEPVPVVGVLYASMRPSEVEQYAVSIARDAEIIREFLIGLDDDAEESLKGLGLIIRS